MSENTLRASNTKKYEIFHLSCTLNMLRTILIRLDENDASVYFGKPIAATLACTWPAVCPCPL